jgi:hypothetical protein
MIGVKVSLDRFIIAGIASAEIVACLLHGLSLLNYHHFKNCLNKIWVR